MTGMAGKPRTSASSTDMTTGGSAGLILGLFFPLLAGNLIQQLYSLADSIIVGKGIGDAAIAAVGASGTIHFLIFGFATGLTHGFGIWFSQAFGAKEMKKLEEYICAAAMLSLLISLVMTILGVAGMRSLFVFMQTPEDILGDAIVYFRIIMLGITVTILNNLAIRILQAIGDGRSTLIAMAFSSVLNILLDLWFVLGLHAGVAGAAAATVAAQAGSLALCASAVRRHGIFNPTQTSWRRSVVYFAPMLKMGIPVALMNSVTAAGTMLLQYFVNRMGSVYVAAYSVSMKYAALFEQVGYAVGLSGLTFAGQNFGAGRTDRIRTGMRQAAIISVIANIPIAILEIFFPAKLAGLMVSAPEVIEQCTVFMPWLGVFIFALGWLFVCRNACQGMGNTFLPMLSGVLEVAMRLTFGWIGQGSFRGIAIAEISAWTGAWLMLWASYRYILAKAKAGRGDGPGQPAAAGR